MAVGNTTAVAVGNGVDDGNGSCVGSTVGTGGKAVAVDSLTVSAAKV
jgi:hypothetical protein